MNILLTSLNSKFVHSNLAIRYLSKCIDQAKLESKEYTINEDIEDIFYDIMKGGYDIVAFSCYIWNIERTEKIIRNIKKARPETVILVGGPEVSYEIRDYLESHQEVDLLVAGEGEEAFLGLNKALKACKEEGSGRGGQAFKAYLADKIGELDIANLFINLDGKILNNSSQESLTKAMVVSDLSLVPMAYEGVQSEELENKIIYYETSRGCNYNCSYCLSAAHKGIRYFDEARVYQELKKLVELGAKQIKLVDRTFNSDPERTMRLLEFIHTIDNGEINFHFEITAHLLTEDQIQVLKNARTGLFQLEIGVQSTHSKTLLAVKRGDNFSRLKENVKEIKKSQNIHQHLDLIAGLPFEDLETFKKSFNDVFSLRPEMLQLGFLKLLKGSPIYGQVEHYGYQFRDYPPYEVISNNFISYEDMIELKAVEEALDRYYNKQRYQYSIKYMLEFYEEAYTFFRDLHSIIASENMIINQKNEEFRALSLLSKKIQEESRKSFESGQVYRHNFLIELLRLDYLMMGRNPNIPDFLKTDQLSPREEIFELLSEEEALIELGFEMPISTKEAFKKISWSNFDYDLLLYYNTGELVQKNNKIIVNYGYKRLGIDSYKAIRRY